MKTFRKLHPHSDQKAYRTQSSLGGIPWKLNYKFEKKPLKFPKLPIVNDFYFCVLIRKKDVNRFPQKSIPKISSE